MENRSAKADSFFMISAFTAWLLSALLLLTLASAAVCAMKMRAASLGYLSSAISFATAFAAGGAAICRRGSSPIWTGLITSAVFTTVLIAAGFVIAGRGLSSSGILSVVTFTIAGCLCGCIMFPKKRDSGRRLRARKS